MQQINHKTIMIAFVYGITLLANRNFNTDEFDGMCIIPKYEPYHCSGMEDGAVKTGFNIPCGRGSISSFTLIMFVLIVFCVPIIISVCLGIMYQTVKVREKRDSNRRSNSRIVLNRAVAYSVSYLLTWGFIIFNFVMHATISQTPTLTWFLATILNPLQGLFNFVIYMHPMVVHSKRQQPGTSWWQAINYAFWSRGEDNRRGLVRHSSSRTNVLSYVSDLAGRHCILHKEKEANLTGDKENSLKQPQPEQPRDDVTRNVTLPQEAVELGPLYYEEAIAERGLHPRRSFIALMQSPLYYEEDVLLIINDNTILLIVSYLDVHEMTRLALTCRRFGGREEQYNNLSMMEGAAHQLFNGAQAVERQALPSYDGVNSFVLYNELLKLRSHLLFDQLVGKGIEYLGNDKSCVTTIESKSDPNTAICNHVMRAGRHYAMFIIVKDGHLLFGVTRPMKGVDNKQFSTFSPFNGFYSEGGKLQNYAPLRQLNDVHVCAYVANGGECTWTSWHRQSREDWEGIETSQVGDRIGLLLDLDEGTLSVYKNDRKLGVMKSGLVGKYCWFVEMSNGPCSVNIRREQVPSSY